jgi:choice-of-anchor A domain-containing protein
MIRPLPRSPLCKPPTGRLAALGKIVVKNYNVGLLLPAGKCALSPSDPVSWGMAAGQSISLTSGQVNNGHITSPSIMVSSGQATPSGCLSKSLINPTARLIDARDTIIQISSNLAGMASTSSSAVVQWTKMTITFNGKQTGSSLR